MKAGKKKIDIEDNWVIQQMSVILEICSKSNYIYSLISLFECVTF